MGPFSPPEFRADERGTWALLRYNERPAAQIFVPMPHRPATQFSFFWLGTAASGDVREIVTKLLQAGSSTVEGRIIGPTHLSTFNFAPWTNGEKAHWDVGMVHHILEAAGLPASVGMAIRSNTDSPDFPSSCYFWASMGLHEGELKPGEPEVGIKVSGQDWHKPIMRGIFVPLLRRSSGIEDEGDAEWLWDKVPEIVQKAKLWKRGEMT